MLDIDYHHGNGTQSIFYERADVFTLSIHGDPATEYPFFDYFRIGQAIATAALPTVFVMEGGYAVAEIGANVVNVPEGFCALRHARRHAVTPATPASSRQSDLGTA